MPDKSTTRPSGSKRRKSTRWSVKASNVLAGIIIRGGGIFTIGAVSLVAVLLIAVVLPLFFDGEVSNSTEPPSKSLATDLAESALIGTGVDEYRTIRWRLHANGQLSVNAAWDNSHLETIQVTEHEITCAKFDIESSDFVLGLRTGAIITGKIEYETSFLNQDDAPKYLQDLANDQLVVHEGHTLSRIPQGQFRLQKLRASYSSEIEISDSPIHLIDVIPPNTDGSSVGAGEYSICTYAENGESNFSILTEKVNMFTGETTLHAETYSIPNDQILRTTESCGKPIKLLVTGRGDNIYMIWEEGTLHRFDSRRPQEISFLDSVDLLPTEDTQVTTCEFTLGRETVMVGDNLGNLNGWFRVRSKIKDDSKDSTGTSVTDAPHRQFVLKRIHPLKSGSAAVSSIGASKRSRMIVVGYADGSLKVFHVTTEQVVLETSIGAESPIIAAQITPKDDGLTVLTKNKIWQAEFDPRHPEASLASLFTPVWYEGYDEPENVWQSSYASSSPEMKLGLRPLIFGTLKATFYTMLFGTPLAILAAIFTSEYLPRKWRAFIKPTIEMMASLPSVVLGFMAAIVIAPAVNDIVPALLLGIFVVPAFLLLGGYFWQLLPQQTGIKLQSKRIIVMLPIIPVGIYVAYLGGPLIEQLWFGGDIKIWLSNHEIGSGIGAWMLVLLPLSILAAAIVVMKWINPAVRTFAHKFNRKQFALLSLAKFLIGSIATLLIAWVISFSLNSAGWDPRGSFVDTYSSRNSLIVGFIMGFAVIPIIYTLADDALSTVPQHLRSASYGAGATTWQTTTRIVIPAAMSGLFSAVMIGLGRAVGETMIVLMAGGNTPVSDWNIFNGFRTLSANIAVELPEAVVGSTHYRTLFLAALTLFVITFVINTVAEVVRLRFRKRAYQL